MTTGATQLGMIATISLVAAMGTWIIQPPSPKPAITVCNPDDLHEDEVCLADIEGSVLWVDARSRAEWVENGISGSILWNLDPLEDVNEMEATAAMRIAPGIDQVVVYCGSKACGTSKQVAEMIRRLGLSAPVKTLYGGWDALNDSEQ